MHMAPSLRLLLRKLGVGSHFLELFHYIYYANLAEKTGRSKSYYAKKAIESFIQAESDYLIAISRLEEKNPKISLEELEKKLGLDD